MTKFPSATEVLAMHPNDLRLWVRLIEKYPAVAAIRPRVTCQCAYGTIAAYVDLRPFGGEYVAFYDDVDLFPSDELITKIMLVAG